MLEYRVGRHIYMFFFFLNGVSRGAVIVEAMNMENAKEILEEINLYPESDRVEKYILEKLPDSLKVETLIPASELFEKGYLVMKEQK